MLLPWSTFSWSLLCVKQSILTLAFIPKAEKTDKIGGADKFPKTPHTPLYLWLQYLECLVRFEVLLFVKQIPRLGASVYSKVKARIPILNPD
jgi:hypothetical protein